MNLLWIISKICIDVFSIHIVKFIVKNFETIKAHLFADNGRWGRAGTILHAAITIVVRISIHFSTGSIHLETFLLLGNELQIYYSDESCSIKHCPKYQFTKISLFNLPFVPEKSVKLSFLKRVKVNFTSSFYFDWTGFTKSNVVFTLCNLSCQIN